MIKIATITPINCITHSQDGEIFAVIWDSETGELHASFEGAQPDELLEHTAQTLGEAIDTVHALYAGSACWVYEPEEVDA